LELVGNHIGITWRLWAREPLPVRGPAGRWEVPLGAGVRVAHFVAVDSVSLTVPEDTLTPHSTSVKFDFSTSRTFGFPGWLFMAQFGDQSGVSLHGNEPRYGYRVVRINVETGTVRKLCGDPDSMGRYGEIPPRALAPGFKRDHQREGSKRVRVGKWLLGAAGLLAALAVMAYVTEPEYAYVPPLAKVHNNGQNRALAQIGGATASQPEGTGSSTDQSVLQLGRKAFYGETFGNEVFLTDIMGILDGPLTLKSFARALWQLGGRGTTNLQVELDKTVTIGGKTFLKGTKIDTGLDVPTGAWTPVGMPVKLSRGRVNVGITCAACHATVARDTLKVVEGAPNSDLNAGLLMALVTNSTAYFTHAEVSAIERFVKEPSRKVTTSDGKSATLPDPKALEDEVDATFLKWPPGFFDSTIDMKANPTKMPHAFTLGNHPAKVDPTPGVPGVNEMVKPPSWPKLTLVAPDGMFVSSPGTRVWEQNNAMAAWQNTLVPPPPQTPVDRAAVSQGRAVFERAGCMSCHAGAFGTNNRVVPQAVVGTQPSRAKALKKTEKLFGPAVTWSFDTPVPVPPGSRTENVPTDHLDPEQIKLAWAHGGSPGGYKVQGLMGLFWTAPYLHDGGVTVGPNPATDLGVSGTL
jgi:hypothetical protein